MAESEKRIGILIPPHLKNKIQAIGEKEHRSLSAQVRFFLERGVEHWESKGNVIAFEEESK